MLKTPGRSRRPDSIRRLNVPVVIRVETDALRIPLRVWYRQRWQQVACVRERYRVKDRWWAPEPISRDYFDLMLENSQVLTVFEDRIQGCWYVQRYR